MAYKQIGKIKSIRVGMGGYQDAQLGVSVTLGGNSWGVGDFKGHWADRSSTAAWTVNDQTIGFGNAMRWLGKLLSAAKVKHADDLKNVPIEATFSDAGMLESWRILTEVM